MVGRKGQDAPLCAVAYAPSLHASPLITSPCYLIHLQEPLEGADAGSGTGSTHGGATMPPGVRYKLGDFGQATPLDLNTPLGFDEGDCRWVAGARCGAGEACRGSLCTRALLPVLWKRLTSAAARRSPCLPAATCPWR